MIPADRDTILRHHAAPPELVAVSAIHEWPDNPRVIGDKAVAHHVGLIRAHGWTVPVMVQRSSSRLVAGHLRLKAAVVLGLEHVPVIWLDVDDDVAARIALSDNPKANDEHGMWDDAALASMYADRGADWFDGLGFGSDKLAELAAAFDPTTGHVPPRLDTAVVIKCPDCGHEFTRAKL